MDYSKHKKHKEIYVTSNTSALANYVGFINVVGNKIYMSNGTVASSVVTFSAS